MSANIPILYLVTLLSNPSSRVCWLPAMLALCDVVVYLIHICIHPIDDVRGMRYFVRRHAEHFSQSRGLIRTGSLSYLAYIGNILHGLLTKAIVLKRAFKRTRCTQLPESTRMIYNFTVSLYM